MTHWPKNSNYRTPYAHEPLHLPEGYHSFGHVSTSGWKRPTALLCKNDTVCVSLCITKQPPKAMMNLIHSVFPTTLVSSSSLVSLYITYPSFLKSTQERKRGLVIYTWGQNTKLCFSKHTRNAALQNLRNSHQINPLVELPSFLRVPTLLSGWGLLSQLEAVSFRK